MQYFKFSIENSVRLIFSLADWMIDGKCESLVSFVIIFEEMMQISGDRRVPGTGRVVLLFFCFVAVRFFQRDDEN